MLSYLLLLWVWTHVQGYMCYWYGILFSFSLHNRSTEKLRQCLLQRPGFQHLIAAAPAAAVILFCCSIYYLSSWHRCPNPNSNNKILEKKKEFVALLLSSAIFGKRVQRDSLSQPSALQPSVITTTPTELGMWCVKVLYLNQINEKNAIY